MPNEKDPREEIPKTVSKLKKQFTNLRPILKAIGALLEARSVRAFEEEQLGEFQWPGRYPAMDEPFINIAGSIKDLESDSKLKDRRFDRRPALQDTGNLLKSVKADVVGEDAVEIGSVLPYAAIHQFGAEESGAPSVQPVGQNVRKNLAKLMKRERRRGGVNFEAIKKLGFLFQVDEVSTNVGKRPFLGITPQDAEEMIEDVEKAFRSP